MNWTSFHLTGLEFAVLILSTFRIVRLIMFDQITSFLRTPFLTEVDIQENGEWVRDVQLAESGWRRWIGQWLSCYWCVGIWCAAVVIALFLFVPFSFPFLLVMAVAGAASLLENISSSL